MHACAVSVYQARSEPGDEANSNCNYAHTYLCIEASPQQTVHDLCEEVMFENILHDKFSCHSKQQCMLNK